MKIKFICNGVKDIPTTDQKSISLLSADATITGNISIVVVNGTPASVSFEVGKTYDVDFTLVTE